MQLILINDYRGVKIYAVHDQNYLYKLSLYLLKQNCSGTFISSFTASDCRDDFKRSQAHEIIASNDGSRALEFLQGNFSGPPYNFKLMDTEPDPFITLPPPVTLTYRNWKGEVGDRVLIPTSVYYGSNEYHKENQYFMVGIDQCKQQERTFAIRDIIAWLPLL